MKRRGAPKLTFQKTPSTSRKKRWGWGRTACVSVFALAIAVSWQKIVSPPDDLPPVPEIEFHYPDSFAFANQYLQRFSVERYIVRSSDTLHDVFRKFGLPTGCLVQWQKSCPEYCLLNNLHPGEELTLHFRRKEKQIIKLVYSASDGSTYTFRKTENGWKCQKDAIPSCSILTTVSGTITDNLYDSCLRSGLPPNLVMELADLFAYDIDFATDLRKSDRFAVHFEARVREGKMVQAGPILAAEMVVSGKSYQAFYYELTDGYKGYFDSNGKSLRKLFLKAPLSYRRISSTFTFRRLHPILKIYRPHLGIDYAAPRGTPISSLGAGKIVYMGRKGGFGKYIEIRHPQNYKTTYGHLSRFAKGLRAGSKVKQGQVIGYVGSTGLATGPHLDFRFYKNGKPINFLKTKFPYARSIPGSLRFQFKKRRDHYLAVLHSKSKTKLVKK